MFFQQTILALLKTVDNRLFAFMFFQQTILALLKIVDNRLNNMSQINLAMIYTAFLNLSHCFSLLLF
ncbi:MAG: hypothetical protein DRR08_24825 [Candidatus Parabeggiatoa sp. nov. 2]|nr:MAG: hypothetical protein DRR08_24825 [Gammaproteobacteria bacterium]